MTTARVKVRDLVAAALVAGVPEVQRRVYRGRSWPLQSDEMPALLVYGWDEVKTNTAKAATPEGLFGVALSLAVEIGVLDRSRDGEEVEREMETIAERVVDVVMEAPALLGQGGAVEWVAAIRTTMGIDATTGDRATGRSLIVFDLRFHEAYAPPPPVIECEDAEIVFAPLPPFAAS